MNLVNDAWIPIRCENGVEKKIAPWQISEFSGVVKLNAVRPDFNGALIQFLIGLLQTTFTPSSESGWAELLENPPSPKILKEKFSKYDYAFELVSERGSFMQDFEDLNAKLTGISSLLIDSPGKNTEKCNRDHFIKRDRIQKLCEVCTATALFTLQTHAPPGGSGYRVSIRGVSPLTTLVILDELGSLKNSLWGNIWLNILDRKYLDQLTGNNNLSSHSSIFPWLAKINGKRVMTSENANPLQMYWAMPRRINVDWNSRISGQCDICDDSKGNLIQFVRVKPHGINYEASNWRHPLSPYYYRKNDNSPQPCRIEKGGMTYLHWMNLIDKQAALVVNRYQNFIGRFDGKVDMEEQFRLYVFGYDMDKMKARCWYEKTFPLFMIPSQHRIKFSKRVQNMTDFALEVATILERCVKNAWFKTPRYAKGDTSFIRNSFTSHTEAGFYRLLQELPQKIENDTDSEILDTWSKCLQNTAFKLFDYWATQGDFAHSDLKRISIQRNNLKKNLFSKKFKAMLQIT